MQTGKHTVTGITRAGKSGSGSGTMPDGVLRVEADYTDEASLIRAFAGQGFVIITLSTMAPTDTHSTLVKAAIKAGVPYIMPNTYGADINNDALAEGNQDLYTGNARKRAHEISELGGSFISLCCGFWYQWSLALGEPWFGIDIRSRKAVLFDQGQVHINVSSRAQCARALAALLSLPESGASPCVRDWKNAVLYVTSFRVSQRDMLDSLNRVMGLTDSDWDITYEPVMERYYRGLEDIKRGDRAGYGRVMYSRTFFPSGDGDFESSRVLDNDKLGLEKEDLDVATDEAVKLVQSGWNPFAEGIPEVKSYNPDEKEAK